MHEPGGSRKVDFDAPVENQAAAGNIVVITFFSLRPTGGSLPHQHRAPASLLRCAPPQRPGEGKVLEKNPTLDIDDDFDAPPPLDHEEIDFDAPLKARMAVGDIVVT